MVFFSTTTQSEAFHRLHVFFIFQKKHHNFLRRPILKNMENRPPIGDTKMQHRFRRFPGTSPRPYGIKHPFKKWIWTPFSNILQQNRKFQKCVSWFCGGAGADRSLWNHLKKVLQFNVCTRWRDLFLKFEARKVFFPHNCKTLLISAIESDKKSLFWRYGFAILSKSLTKSHEGEVGYIYKRNLYIYLPLYGTPPTSPSSILECVGYAQKVRFVKESLTNGGFYPYSAVLTTSW